MKSQAEIKIAPDSQLLIPGLHDAQLVAIHLDTGAMQFRSADNEEIEVTLQSPINGVWCSGQILPNTVSCLYLIKSSAMDQMDHVDNRSVIDRFIEEWEQFGRSDWILAITFSVGDSIFFAGADPVRMEYKASNGSSAHYFG